MSNQHQPTVYLVIGTSAIAFDDRGEILETVEWIDGRPDWRDAGICDHRGAGGDEGYRMLDNALRAAERNAELCGFTVERVGYTETKFEETLRTFHAQVAADTRDADYRCPDCGFGPRPTLAASHDTTCPRRDYEWQFLVEDVEACEPNELLRDLPEGITFTISGTHGGSAKCPSVNIMGPTREAVLDFVAVNWGIKDGSGDGEWFEDQVVKRVVQDLADPEARQWVVTENPADVHATLWTGRAKTAIEALDAFAEEKEFARYSDLLSGSAGPEHAEGLVGDVQFDGSRWAIFTNTTVYAIPVTTVERPLLGPQHDVEPERTILVHLNVEVPSDDTRSYEEIAHSIITALAAYDADERLDDLGITMALAEEVA